MFTANNYCTKYSLETFISCGYESLFTMESWNEFTDKKQWKESEINLNLPRSMF